MTPRSLTSLLGAMATAAAIAAATAAPAAATPGEVIFARGGDLHAKLVDGAERRLTTGSARDAFPAWSPDHSRIAFVRNDSLHVMRADGTDLRRLTNRKGDRYPTWSPDGRHVAFISDRSGRRQIWIVDIETGRVRQLGTPGAARLPAWSRRLGRTTPVPNP